MNSLLQSSPLLLVLTALLLPSCDLVTVPRAPADSRVAGHVVINEVFVLPWSSPNPYSWFELYNASTERVGGLDRWSLSVTYQFSISGRDTAFESKFMMSDVVGALPDTLEPGQFLLLYSDSISFYSHTNLGPGKGRASRTFVMLPERGQLELRDTSNAPVDVVRYGHFVPPSPDRHPGNQSAGVIPQWSSLCRYAGAYATGNTANDFYIESKPIPMWYSQLNHP
jgi:hypothetical protein